MTTPKLPHDDEHVEIRLPRSVLTVVERPRTVSQRTSGRVLGIPRRAYLEAVREFARDGGAVLELDKLRLVHVDDFLRWLGARSRAVEAASLGAPQGDRAAELARELGLVGVA